MKKFTTWKIWGLLLCCMMFSLALTARSFDVIHDLSDNPEDLDSCISGQLSLVSCNGNQVTLSAPEGYDSYQWNNGSTSTTATYTVNDTTMASCLISTMDCEFTLVATLLTQSGQPAVSSVIYDTICEGERYSSNYFNLPPQNEIGTHVFHNTFYNVNTCSGGSISTTLYLTVQQSEYHIYDVSCLGQDYNANGFNIPAVLLPNAGNYTLSRTFQGSKGCDSFVALHLTVNPTYAVSDSMTICAKELPYEWNGVVFTEAGTQMDTLQTVNGCDSVVTMFLMVNDTATGIDEQVACDSLTWLDGVTYYASTNNPTYTYYGGAANGCDSVVTLHLTLNYSSHNVLDTSVYDICTWHDSTYVVTGTYTYAYINANGCASVDTLHLTVRYGTHDVYDTVSLCRSELPVMYDTLTIMEAGDYQLQLTSSLGEDSLVQLHVIVNENPVPVIEGDLSHCVNVRSIVYVDETYVSYLWSTGGTDYYTMTTDSLSTVMVTDANGCTGTDTVVFEILPSPEVDVIGNTSLCYLDTTVLKASGAMAYYWSKNGVNVSYTDSLVYVAEDENGYYDTIKMRAYSNHGCITQTEIHFEVFPQYQGVDTVFVCRSELPYQRLDSLYAEEGTYPVHYQSQQGCDSLIMMTLVIKENPEVRIVGADSLCADQLSAITASGAESYLWSTQSTSLSIVVQPGQSYWLKGTAANGCSTTDSITVRSLTVPVVSIEGPTEACYGDDITLTASECYAYHWSDGSSNASLPIHATESSVYQVTVANIHDCYATATASVTVYPVYDTSISVTCCSNDLPYLYHGHSFNQNGTYEVHLTTIHGCDSLVHLTLNILESPYAIISGNAEICPGASTQLSANGNGTFRWNTGVTRSPITVNTPGWYVLTVTATNGCKAYDSVEVAHLPLPNITINGNSSVCRGSELLLIASGAYSYNWNTGVMGPVLSVTPNQTTSYVVTGTSDRGCTSTAAHTVVVNSIPTANITGPDAVCQGNTAVFTASGGSQYVWSHGPTTASVQLSNEQLYTVEVTNQAGCTSTASKYLTVNSVPSVSILGQAYFCEGGSSMLTASGIGAISYVWNNTNIGQSYTVTNPGFYTVVATSSANCTASASINVVRRSNPVILVSGNTSFCDGETTQLTASGGQTYVWKNNYGALISNTNAVTLSEGGSYTVIATDEYACSATQPVNVVKKNLPVVSIVASSNEVCEGTTVSLGAGWSSGYSYHWNTGSNNRQIEVTTSGVYVLEVTANGCLASDSVEILVHPLPEIVISGDTIITEGETATVYATAAQVVSYHWNTGSNFNYISVTPATTTYYTVDVTNVYGCSSQKNFRIVVNTTPTIVGNDAICVGDSTLLQAFGGVSYQWNDGVMTASRYVLAPGTYVVTVTNSAGYTATASKTISYYGEPTVSINGDQDLCKGESTTLTASNGVSYSWSTGATSQSITVTPSQNTTYSVSITDQNGCRASASLSVVVQENAQLLISGNDHFCNGDSVVLTASGANQLVWSTGQIGSRLVVYESGDYSVSSSNTDMCVSTATQHVEKYQLPMVSITGPSSLCDGESANLTVVTNESVTYAWNTGATTDAINVNSTGDYSVTVTDSHACSAQASKTVTVHDLPTVTINAPSTSCAGTAVTLNAIGNASQYDWSTGATGSSITVYPLSTTSYQVTAISEHECTSSASATVVVNPTYDTTIRVSCCSSELPYVYNGQSFNQSGTYIVNLTTENACDSIIHLVLTVNENPYAIISGNTEICPGGNTQLSASGNGSIRWNTGYDRSPITVNTPGWYVLTVTAANGCQSVDSVEVTHLPLPNVVINGESIVCRGAEVMLMATGASSYNWNTGVTGPVLTITPQQTTTYMVTGTTDRGCTATASHVITVNATPTASISGVDAICQGETAVFTATGGTSYLWSTGATTASVQLTEAQQYTVEVSNQYGCTATATKSLEVNALPTVNIMGQDYFCAGGSVTLSATGTGVVSYLWNESGAGQSYVVSSPGVYTVQVTSPANCTATASISVSQQPVPVVSVTGEVSFCDGQSTQLTASGGQNYVWRNAYGAQIANTASLNLSEGGTYSVVVSDAYGCSSSQQLMVTKKNLPTVTIMASDNEVCEGTPVSLNAGWVSGYSYQWSTGSTERQITVNSGGTYVLQVTANGCSATDSTTIIMHPLPNIYVTGDTVICKGDMATINAISNASSFLWNTGATDPVLTIMPQQTSSYVVTGTSDLGCTATASYVLTVNETPAASISGVDAICQGETAVFTATGGTSYLWSTGETTASIQLNDAQQYTVEVTNQYGCTATATKSLEINVLPTVNIMGQDYFCTGGSVTLSATGTEVASYLWNGSGEGQSYEVSVPGIYTVQATSPANCTATASVTITQQPLPEVSITGPSSLCDGENANLTVVTNESVTYAWNTGATTDAINVNSTGDYSVTVTDSHACSAQASKTVTVHDLPTVTINAPSTSCAGTAVTLNAIGNASQYDWSTGATGSSITVYPLSTTSYQVTAISEHECTSSASATVVVNPTYDTTIRVSCCSSELPYVYNGQSFNQSGTYIVNLTTENACDSIIHLVLTVNENPYAIISGNTEICPGGNTQLSATANGTFVWNTGYTRSPITVNTPGWYVLTVTAANGCQSVDSVEVTHLPLPNVVINGESSICRGAEVMLMATGASSYNWNTGVTGPALTITPQQTTTYMVTGTSDRGCTATASHVITVNATPTASISGVDAICQGETAVFTATGGTSYLWSTGATTASVQLTEAQQYTVEVSNQYGCTATATKSLEVNALPTVNIMGQDYFCEGGSVTLSATGTGVVSYLWNESGAGQSYVVSSPGVYTVQVTSSANCTATASISVSQQPVPVVSVTGEVSFCDGQSTQLTASGGQNYVWRNAYGAQIANTASLNLSEGGTYSVVVSDAYGCSSSQQLMVTKKNLPTVTIMASDNEVCEGTLVSLNAGWVSGYSYQWSTGSTERQITVNSGGTYVLQVTANGCSATDSTTIIMHPLPNISFTGDTVICKGDMATIHAISNASSFLWNTGATINEIAVSPLANSNYWVMVEDLNGCRNQDTVLVRVEELPIPTISGPDSICEGTSATLIASGGISYLWDDGSTDAERLVQSSGIYTVTVFASSGCSATAQKNVYYYDMQAVTISGDTIMCVGDSVLLMAHGALNYLWSNMSSDTSLLVSAPGIYAVEAWDAHGCASRDSIMVSEKSLPSVHIVGNSEACAGNLNVLTAQASTDVSYLWNTGSTSAQIQVSASGVYVVEVTDANACKSSASFTFQLIPTPSCEILGRTNICLGDTTTLTASNGMYFFWSTGAVSQSITVTPSTTTTYNLVIMDEDGCSANTSAQVVVNPKVSITIAGSSDFCDGDSVLLVANTNYELLWSDGQQGDSIYVHETGDYTVHAVDPSSCLLPSTFHVEKHLSPELQIVGDAYLCLGDTGVLYAQTNEAVTYQWNTGSTDSSVHVTSINVYSVTVTDNYGCTNTASKLLMVYSAPTISVTGPTIICNGAEAILTASGSATHFYWSTGDTTASITVNPRYTTTYQVVGSNDYGCSATATWNLTVASLPVVSISGDTALCQGDVTVLTSSNASSFHWSTGSNNRSINVATTGTYTVTVTNSTGCTNSASIYVHVYEQPNLMILGDTMLCYGEQTELLAIGAVSYLWNDGSTSPNIVVAPESSTSYTVQAYNGVCMVEATRQVVVNERPSASITAPDGICEGSAVTLSAHGGMAYLWSTGQTAAMIDAQASGTYQLIAFNQYGCTDTTSHTLIQYSNPQISITGPAAICPDAEGILTAVGDGSILWNTGDTATSITITTPGYYSVQVTDLNGCSATTSQNVSTLSSPVIVIAGPNDMCADETVSLTAVCANASSFSWNTGASNNTIQVSPSSTTTYLVTATSADGCMAQQSHTLAVHSSYAVDFTDEICQGHSYSGYGFSVPVQDVPGEYEFTENLQTIYGCDSIRTLHLLVRPKPVIAGNIVGNSEVTSPGNFVYMIDPVENATMYEWILSNPNWSVSYNQTVAQVTITTPGSATLSVYALNDCGPSEPVSMQITYGVGIDDAEMSVVKVFPNPTNGFINVQLTTNNEQLFSGEIQLLDMYGKLLNRWEMSGNDMQLDLSSFAAGVYLLKLHNSQNSTESVVKVVKQ